MQRSSHNKDNVDYLYVFLCRLDWTEKARNTQVHGIFSLCCSHFYRLQYEVDFINNTFYLSKTFASLVPAAFTHSFRRKGAIKSFGRCTVYRMTSEMKESLGNFLRPNRLFNSTRMARVQFNPSSVLGRRSQTCASSNKDHFHRPNPGADCNEKENFLLSEGKKGRWMISLASPTVGNWQMRRGNTRPNPILHKHSFPGQDKLRCCEACGLHTFPSSSWSFPHPFALKVNKKGTKRWTAFSGFIQFLEKGRLLSSSQTTSNRKLTRLEAG